MVQNVMRAPSLFLVVFFVCACPRTAGLQDSRGVDSHVSGDIAIWEADDVAERIGGPAFAALPFEVVSRYSDDLTQRLECSANTDTDCLVFVRDSAICCTVA